MSTLIPSTCPAQTALLSTTLAFTLLSLLLILLTTTHLLHLSALRSFNCTADLRTSVHTTRHQFTELWKVYEKIDIETKGVGGEGGLDVKIIEAAFEELRIMEVELRMFGDGERGTGLTPREKRKEEEREMRWWDLYARVKGLKRDREVKKRLEPIKKSLDVGVGIVYGTLYERVFELERAREEKMAVLRDLDEETKRRRREWNEDERERVDGGGYEG